MVTERSVSSRPLTDVALPTKEAGEPTEAFQPVALDYLTKAATTPKGGKEHRSNLDVEFAHALSKIHKGDRFLFDAGGPKLEHIHQGGMGDCFCVAPLGAFLHRDPQAVIRLFALGKNGKVHVTLGGGREIEIPVLTDAEFVLAG